MGRASGTGARRAAGITARDRRRTGSRGTVSAGLFAHNHRQIHRSAVALDLAVHVTAHAVAIEDRRARSGSWGFVATHRYRLRTPSVIRALTDGRVVVVELAGGPQERGGLLLIDPRAGHSAWRDDVRSWTLDARGLEINGHMTPAAQLAAILGS